MVTPGSVRYLQSKNKRPADARKVHEADGEEP